MCEENRSSSFRILMAMHNLGLVKPETSKTGAEIAEDVNLDVEETLKILHRYEGEGQVKSLLNPEETRFYLTGYGILAFCGSFT